MMAQNVQYSHYSFPGLVHNIEKTISKPDEIIKTVCNVFEIEPELLRGKSRKFPLSDVRHIAAYMVRKFTFLSMEKIGELFIRDHSTIIHSCKCVENMKYTRDPQYIDRINRIEFKLFEKYNQHDH